MPKDGNFMLFALSMIIAVTLLCASMAVAAESGRVLYRTGFENDEDGLIRWVEHGDITVHYAGFSEEKAFKGKRSYKIDVTLNSGVWSYWQTKLMIVPLDGSPSMRGAMLVEPADAKVSIGYRYASPETGSSGMTGHCAKLRTHPSGWSEWEAKVTPNMTDTDHVEAICLYIFGKPGDRIVAYVDDLQIRGNLPPDYETTVSERIKHIEAARDAEYSKVIERLSADFGSLRPVSSSLSETAPPLVKATVERLSTHYSDNLPVLKAEIERLRTHRGSVNDLASLRSNIRLLEMAARSSKNAPAYAERHGERPYMTYVVPPTRDEKVLPESFPIPGVMDDRLSATACPDEYEPASFVIHADSELKNVRVSISDLSADSGESRIVPTTDVYAVKCWWQSGRAYNDLMNPLLTPELLLKDPGIIRVDNERKRNEARNPYAHQDAKELQPVSIPAGTNQQYWIIVHAPKGTAPGVYNGVVKITMDDIQGMDLPLSVNVLPFELEEPVLEYGIYYRGKLSDEEWTETELRAGTDAKSERQFKAELADMKAHGVRHPSCYVDVEKDDKLDFTDLKRAFEIRKELGLTSGPILKMHHGLNTWQYVHEKDIEKRKVILEQIEARTKEWMSFVEETGYPTPLFYGIDEAGAEVLEHARTAYKTIKDSGGKCGVAIYPVFLHMAMEYLDRTVVPTGLSAPMLKSVHDLGNKVWIYGNPIVCVEDPETYRRNYGLAAWKSGVDGVCPYVYQQQPDGEPWDEFDNKAERALNMTYPTLDGVVSTIQWEGFREGYDDVRYLSTLLKHIADGKKSEKSSDEALKAEKWLSDLDVSGDLDLVRGEMVEWIMKLKNAMDQTDQTDRTQ